MSNKPTVKEANQINDVHCEVVWKPMTWCEMQVRVTTMHEITELINEPDVDYSQMEWAPDGEVTEVEIVWDQSVMHKLCNNGYSMTINDFLLNQIQCTVTEKTEFS